MAVYFVAHLARRGRPEVGGGSVWGPGGGRGVVGGRAGKVDLGWVGGDLRVGRRWLLSSGIPPGGNVWSPNAHNDLHCV